jgi:hypothetical protein
MPRWPRLTAALSLLAVSMACTPGGTTQVGSSNEGTSMKSTTEAQDNQGTRQFITNTAQAQFGDSLRVGAGNIWEADYVDETGASRKGLTGGLWFFLRDHPELDRHVRVHPGQHVEFGDYRIQVLSVEPEGIGLSVQLPESHPDD